MYHIMSLPISALVDSKICKQMSNFMITFQCPMDDDDSRVPHLEMVVWLPNGCVESSGRCVHYGQEYSNYGLD